MRQECVVFIKEPTEIEAVQMTPKGTQERTSCDEDDINGQSEDDKNLLNNIKEEQNKQSDARARDKTQQTKIQKVPPTMLRHRNFDEYYKPRAMLIGPLQRTASSETSLQEKLKVKLAAKFIEASGVDGERLLQKIKNNIKELKERFDENEVVSYNDEALARMLFLDGCSILQFINSFLNDELKEFGINGIQAKLIQQDLFLLENQIPFQVLVLLMQLSVHKDKFRSCIHTFVLLNIMTPASYYLKELKRGHKFHLQDEKTIHLLDLLRSELLFDDEDDGGADKDEDNSSLCSLKSSSLQDSHPPRNRFLHFIYRLLFGDFGNSAAQISSLSRVAHQTTYKWSFRNIQDLKEKGIKLKPSTSRSLRAITFSTPFFITGQLKLPPLIVDDSTARKLCNLVAFEMCPDNCKANSGVISYLSFLDSLIDTEQDVKDLRSAHIVRNRLSSDAQVAELFNKIGSNMVPDEAYYSVKNKIQKYYERRSATWAAQVYRDHFQNPWTILALFATTTLLTLTAIQTWFSAYSGIAEIPK